MFLKAVCQFYPATTHLITDTVYNNVYVFLKYFLFNEPSFNNFLLKVLCIGICKNLSLKHKKINQNYRQNVKK